jgi:hypothetical protein
VPRQMFQEMGSLRRAEGGEPHPQDLWLASPSCCLPVLPRRLRDEAAVCRLSSERVVGAAGIEPAASSVLTRRSATELRARYLETGPNRLMLDESQLPALSGRNGREGRTRTDGLLSPRQAPLPLGYSPYAGAGSRLEPVIASLVGWSPTFGRYPQNELVEPWVVETHDRDLARITRCPAARPHEIAKPEIAAAGFTALGPGFHAPAGSIQSSQKETPRGHLPGGVHRSLDQGRHLSCRAEPLHGSGHASSRP